MSRVTKVMFSIQTLLTFICRWSWSVGIVVISIISFPPLLALQVVVCLPLHFTQNRYVTSRYFSLVVQCTLLGTFVPRLTSFGECFPTYGIRDECTHRYGPLRSLYLSSNHQQSPSPNPLFPRYLRYQFPISPRKTLLLLEEFKRHHYQRASTRM